LNETFLTKHTQLGLAASGNVITGSKAGLIRGRRGPRVESGDEWDPREAKRPARDSTPVGNPAVVGPLEPVDRKLCVLTFR